MIKFVKITKDNADAQAELLGFADEKHLLEETGLDSMVGLWVDVVEEEHRLATLYQGVDAISVVDGRATIEHVTLLMTGENEGVMTLNEYLRHFT